MRISGNTILITGGTSGIGLGLAQRFHTEGNTVIIAGRRRQLLSSITAQHPGMDSVAMDVSDPASIRRAVAAVTERHPGLDVIINNAGVMLPEDLTTPAHRDVAEQTVVTNLLGPIRVLAELMPVLLEKPAAVVMNVSSGLAFVPLPITATYCATKAAIHSYTESLRAQLAGTAVQVLELIPPAVQTDLMGQAARGQGMPLPAFLDEVMHLLRTDPEAVEICVNDVLFMREAEADGSRASVFAMLSGAH